jgi:hypothetical protein
MTEQIVYLENDGKSEPADKHPVDWTAVEALSGRLGAHTRRLVANRDFAVAAWARTMAGQCVGASNEARAVSYLELAALVIPERFWLDGEERPE